MKIEKKITFVVAGIEFDDLKVAQFFQRAIRLNLVNLDDNEQEVANDLISWWKTRLNSVIAMDKEETVYSIMNLQLPKPARKTTPKKKNVQEPEVNPEFEMIPDDDIYSNPLN